MMKHVLHIKHRLLFSFLFLLLSMTLNAQSSITEIMWHVDGINYSGLLVLYPNDNGLFKVKFFVPGQGWVWCAQDAVVSRYSDAIFINCYNPRTVPYSPYAADNFMITADNQIYTQDWEGQWTNLIVGNEIPTLYWRNKMTEYFIK